MSAPYSQVPPTDSNDAAYRSRIQKWRVDYENDLKKNEGWLSVAGLFWLKEGETTIGANSTCGVVLPHGSASDLVGTLENHEGHVKLTVAPGARATIQGKAVSSQELATDTDRVATGSVTWMAIRRGSRTGIRLFDLNSKGRKQFEGCKWFAIDTKFRIRAKYVAYPVPRSMPITNVLGDTQPVSNPGYVTFTLGGKECRLEAQAAGAGFFFNFTDLTTGKSTYPAGRFLDAPGAVSGEVLLDFNQATNPPCAFTTFATCPLPPRSNYLDVSIPAGEKTHHPVEN